MDLEYIKTSLKRYTFQVPKIKEWVEDNSFGLVLNLFAGLTKLNLNEIRNDIDPDSVADYHLDAYEFVKGWNGEMFDTVILDPPYAYRKALEMYNGNYTSKFKLIADELRRIVKPSASIISFGYHNTFMGEVRGYELSKLCVFGHSGAQHCTIGIVERQKEIEE